MLHLQQDFYKELHCMNQEPTQPQQQTPPVAPTPPAAQPPTGNSKVTTIIIAVVVSVVVVFGLIIGGIILLANSGDSTTGSSSSSVENVKKEAKLGSTIDLGKVEVSVGDTEKKTELNQYSQAPEGNVYVFTYIKVTNNSDADLSLSGFELRTKENKIEFCSPAYGDDYKQFDDQLAPDGETEGDLYCEISEDDDVKSINFKTYGTGNDYRTYEAVFTN